MPTSGRNNGQLEGFRAAAQSLKLYRRADLVNESATSIVKDLYVDPLGNESPVCKAQVVTPQDSRSEESRGR